jgi:hypothetical protein
MNTAATFALLLDRMIHAADGDRHDDLDTASNAAFA